MNGTLTGTATPSQRGLKSNGNEIEVHFLLTRSTALGQSCPRSIGNEWVLHILRNFRTGASLSGGLVSYPELFFGGVLFRLVGWSYPTTVF